MKNKNIKKFGLSGGLLVLILSLQQLFSSDSPYFQVKYHEKDWIAKPLNNYSFEGNFNFEDDIKWSTHNISSSIHYIPSAIHNEESIYHRDESFLHDANSFWHDRISYSHNWKTDIHTFDSNIHFNDSKYQLEDEEIENK